MRHKKLFIGYQVISIPLALFGLIVLFILVSNFSAISKRDKYISDFPDETVQYASLDDSMSLQQLLSTLNSVFLQNIPEVNHQMGVDQAPEPRLWLYSNMKEGKSAIFLDYLFPCPSCPKEEIFDICRFNVLYKPKEGFILGDRFFRWGVNYTKYITLDNDRN